MTVVAGVAGQPIAHSLSPVIHGAWIQALGLDARYERFGPADEAGFEDLVQQVRDGIVRGLNITAPFKEKALLLADRAGEVARTCGAANLLTMRDGQIVADSTDGQGVLAALSQQAPGLSLPGRRVVILGAGGAARGGALALKSAGADVHIVNRTQARAEALAADLGVTVSGPEVLSSAALVVNALSVQPDIDLGVLNNDAVVMDMTYKPLTTPLLAAARARGLTTVDGLGMLIGQAGPSFRALFGMEPPPVDVRALCLQALGEAE